MYEAIDVQLESSGILPLIVADTTAEVRPVLPILQEAGIRCVEIGLRTDGALEILRELARGGSGIIAGAGTVRTHDQARRACDLGARFVVTPGLNPEIVRYCLGRRVPVFPGVATATEIDHAITLGCRKLKLFPAGTVGGLDFLDAVHPVFPEAVFIPTGGVDETVLEGYLRHPAVYACAGTWLTRPDEDGGTSGVRERVARAVALARSVGRTFSPAPMKEK